MHPILYEVTGRVLDKVFFQNHSVDRALEQEFRSHSRLGSRDRRWIAERVYGVLRFWRRLWFVLDVEPTSARLIEVVLLLDLLEGQEWRGDLGRLGVFSEPSDWKKKVELARIHPAVWHSVPDWLMREGEEQLGKQWLHVLQASLQMAPVDLRVNALLTSPEQAKKKLEQEGVSLQELGDSALTLLERKNVFSTQAFRDGWFEVQDRASQKVAPFLQVQPGQVVIDACAGGGGKTLHLASLMRNQGKILALDIDSKRLENLKLRARRARVSMIETREISSTKVFKRLRDRADALLLDVPCSGSGVWRRKPQNKWWLSSEKLNELHNTQNDILERSQGMLKVGGVMVYSTCSVFPSENRQQVDAFLQRHPEFSLEDEWNNLPSPETGDGFYMARLRRET